MAGCLFSLTTNPLPVLSLWTLFLSSSLLSLLVPITLVEQANLSRILLLACSQRPLERPLKVDQVLHEEIPVTSDEGTREREREAEYKEKNKKEREREQFVSHLKRRAIHRARCTRVKVLLWQRIGEASDRSTVDNGHETSRLRNLPALRYFGSSSEL